MSQTTDTDSRFSYLEIDDDRPVTHSPTTTTAPKAATAPTPAPAASAAPTTAPAAPAAPTARQERLRTYLASRRAESLAELRAAHKHLVDATAKRSTPERLETIADIEALIADRTRPAPSMSISAPIPAPIESQPLAIAVQAATETLRAPAISARRGEISAAPSAARPMPRYVAPTPAPQNRATNNNLVVVDEAAASDAGRLVYYTGHAISAAKLAEAWTAHNVADHVSSRPEPAEPATAFARACRSLASTKTLVRSVPNSSEWVIVEERDTSTNQRKQYTTVCRARLGAQGIEITPVDGLPHVVELYRQQIAATYAAASDTIDAVDVTSWLVTTIKRLGGWHVRENGGVYYTPRRRNEAIESIKRALQACGIGIWAIPVMPGTDAIQVAITGLAATVTKRLGELRDECAAEERGPKVVARRLDEIGALRQMVRENESLLGLQLAAVHAELDAVKTLWEKHASRGAMLDVG